MKKYTFLEAALKAEIGQHIQDETNELFPIKKEQFCFRWADDTKHVITLGQTILNRKFYIIEEREESIRLRKIEEAASELSLNGLKIASETILMMIKTKQEGEQS